MVDLTNATWVQYPSLDRAEQLRKNGRELLGRVLHWTEKRDGSNISVWLTAGEPTLGGQFLETISVNGIDYKVVISSRNQRVASPNFIQKLQSTNEYKKVVEFLRENPSNVVFGELVPEGVTPARAEPKHKKSSYTVFDIYDREFDLTKGGRFLGYNAVYQKMYQFRVPTVRLLAVTRHNLLFLTDKEGEMLANPDDVRPIIQAIGADQWTEFADVSKQRFSFYFIQELMLRWSRLHRREGTVVKSFADDGMTPIYAKEKIDLPSRANLRSVADNKIVNLPPLPKSEVMGAINKVHTDVGDKTIRDKTLAMPLIAKAVSIECVKHMCAQPTGKIYDYYLEYLQGLNMSVVIREG